MDQQKISKSIEKTIIDPLKIIDQYGIVALRFYCIKINLIGKDHSFSIQEMLELYNNLLVNKFSNLVYRIYSLAIKYNISYNQNMVEDYFKDSMYQSMQNLNIQQYVEEFFTYCDQLNGSITKQEIWREKNRHIIPGIMRQINGLLKYIVPIIGFEPQVIDKNQQPIKLFTPLQE